MAGKNTGLGATLVFSGDIVLTGLRIRSIGALRESVEALDDTALDSLGYYEVVPDDLLKTDPVQLETYYDGKKTIPTGVCGTMTITFPLLPTETTPATVTGTGFIVDHSKPSLAPGQRLITNLTIQFDGKTGPAFTAAT